MSADQSDKRTSIATLELSAGCLQEASERLHRLCPRLPDEEHQTECTETAKNISSQVTVIRRELTGLRDRS
jgi:hypothetical protein